MAVDFGLLRRRSKFWLDNMSIQKDFITVEEQAALMAEATEVDFKTAPTFLGPFGMACYGEHYGRGRKLPPTHKAIALRMMAQLPAQKFNCAFLQRYSKDVGVKRHRDPKDNVGHTLILTYGPFESYDFWCKSQWTIRPRTLIKLPCTMEFEGELVQGPEHYAYATERGERFSLILNTIKR